jgi:hypothetical protein
MPAAPGRFELRTRQDEWMPFLRILNQWLAPIDLAKDHVPPILLVGDGENRRPGECFPVGFDGAGLEPEVFGSEEKIGIR